MSGLSAVSSMRCSLSDGHLRPRWVLLKFLMYLLCIMLRNNWPQCFFTLSTTSHSTQAALAPKPHLSHAHFHKYCNSFSLHVLEISTSYPSSSCNSISLCHPQTLPALIMKIMRGIFEPIHPHYSTEMRSLVHLLLHTDPAQRPDCHQVISHPLVFPALCRLHADLGMLRCVSRWETNVCTHHFRQYQRISSAHVMLLWTW